MLILQQISKQNVFCLLATTTDKDGKGPLGLAKYIQDYVCCSKCVKSTKLELGFKSGKFYLKCPTCGNMDYLSKDDVNAYIDLNKCNVPGAP